MGRRPGPTTRTMTAPVYVLYHSPCDDGFAAAWAAWKALRGHGVYVPVRYGQPPPALPAGARVVLVDFAYPRDTLLALRRHVAELTVLDHHTTAQADLAGLDGCIFDMERSGAGLAWAYWHPHEPAPTLIRYVEDRDLWRKALPHVDEFTAWLRSYPYEFHVWRRLAWEMEQGTGWVAQGAAILRYQRRTAELHADEAVVVGLGGYQVPVAPAPVNLRSEVPGVLLERYPDAPFAAGYYDRADGARVWSLRSRGEVDVSEIARRYVYAGVPGGGHRAAAGFQSAQPPRGPEEAGRPEATASDGDEGDRRAGSGMSAEPRIPPDDYQLTLAGLWAMANLIANAPLAEMLAAAERAETLGPIVDPTLYRERARALSEDLALLRAFRAVQDVLREMHHRKDREGMP